MIDPYAVATVGVGADSLLLATEGFIAGVTAPTDVHGYVTLSDEPSATADLTDDAG